ncbi:hypothetical protein [Sebaldella sp. S0638]|uniref:hypothetical protein n=1 Tax=Sebaldella sp. S0638 TaxID=2957809 RepID=UPI00209F2B93|nr:hypothetical protein [Sebaldella sp. S0638]MCP1226289.1 hypothetical protein [Sebaldella sp. S0638]
MKIIKKELYILKLTKHELEVIAWCVNIGANKLTDVPKLTAENIYKKIIMEK